MISAKGISVAGWRLSILVASCAPKITESVLINNQDRNVVSKFVRFQR
jgi:hypothetical protein